MIKILSHEIVENGPYYGGANGFERNIVANMENGDSCNQQVWNLNNHTGTHIDCPRHFSKTGKQITDYPAEEWVFEKVYFLDLPLEKEEMVEPSDAFQNIPLDCDALILKSGFEKWRGQELYWNNNPGLTPELGNWLRKERPNLKLIGFDFISITSYQNRPLGRIAHKAFLHPEEDSEGLRVIEDMKLSEIEKAPKRLVVSPVMIEADGSPVTVFGFFD